MTASRRPSRPRLRWAGLLVLGSVLMIPALLGAWRALRERARPAAPPPRSAALELAQREAVFHDPSGLDERSVKALGRTFAKLRQLEARRVERVAVLQLGASHTAGQYF